MLTDDPAEAVAGADVVYTDVWVCMSDDEDSAAARREALAPYAITTSCSTGPRPTPSRCTACPAHPGEEITESVLYGDRQRIWDQAENRRHAQKALLELLVSTARAGRVGASGHAAGQEGSGRARSVLNPLDVMVITRERLQDTLDDAVRRGRMTRDDATDLLAEIVRRAISGARRPGACARSSASPAPRTSSRSPTTTT